MVLCSAFPALGSASSVEPALAMSEFLIIGRTTSVIATAVAVGNYELGANSQPVPMPGLTLVQPIPANAKSVPVGITGDGDVAIVDPIGTFQTSNVGIWAETGVQCAASSSACNAGTSNTTFNGLPFPPNGLVGGVIFTDVIAELYDAKWGFPTLVGDHHLALDLSDDGKFATNTVIPLAAGLTVVDIDTGGQDLLLENGNLLFDGPSGAFAIVRIPDNANFNVTQSTILVSDTMGSQNVILFSDKPDNDAHFNFSSVVINGVAIWDLSMMGTSASEVSLDNVQGCTQVVGNKITLQDVRLSRCAAVVPEPGSLGMLGLGLAGLYGASALRRRAGR